MSDDQIYFLGNDGGLGVEHRASNSWEGAPLSSWGYGVMTVYPAHIFEILQGG